MLTFDFQVGGVLYHGCVLEITGPARRVYCKGKAIWCGDQANFERWLRSKPA